MHGKWRWRCRNIEDSENKAPGAESGDGACDAVKHLTNTKVFDMSRVDLFISYQ